MEKRALLTITVIAMGLIAFLAGIALLNGQDGVILTMAISTIAGLGGYTVGRIKTPKKPDAK